jgi:hypothetical protein
MFQFGKKSYIQALRHVLSPSMSISWRPDFSEDIPLMSGTGWGMYQPLRDRTTGAIIVDANGKPIKYSVNEQGIYGTAGSGKNASLSFSLGNTLEMKIRSKGDSIETTDPKAKSKKIKLLESLNFSSSYNLLADSMNLSPISFSGRTTLFGNFGINFSGTLNPYAINENGTVYNKWYYQDHENGLVRLTNFSLSFGYSFNRTEAYKHAEQYAALAALDPEGRYDGIQFAYVDFSLPWNFSFSYSFSYSKPGHTKTTNQTLNFNGDISLTPKWKIGFQSGWDFNAGKVSSSSFNLHRDLHCWEMRFSWIPMGSWQSWNFGINIKSAMLKDLKYDKRQSRYDQTPDY